MKNLIAVFMLGVCLCTLSACRKNVSTNPTVVQAVALQDAENTVKSVEDGLNAANDVIENLQTAEPGYYAKIKPILRRLSSLNATASRKLNVVAQGGSADWKGAIVDVGNSITIADLTNFGFKNPNSQAAVDAGMELLVGALNTLKRKFGTV